MFSVLKALLIQQFEVLAGAVEIAQAEFRDLEDRISSVIRGDAPQAAFFCAMTENLYGRAERSVSASELAMKRLEAGNDAQSVVTDMIGAVSKLHISQYGDTGDLLREVMWNPLHYLQKMDAEYWHRTAPKPIPNAKSKKGNTTSYIPISVLKKVDRDGFAPLGLKPYADLKHWNPQPVIPKFEPEPEKEPVGMSDEMAESLYEEMYADKGKKQAPTRNKNASHGRTADSGKKTKNKNIKQHQQAPFAPESCLAFLAQDLEMVCVDKRSKGGYFWIMGEREVLEKYRQRCKLYDVEFTRYTGEREIPEGQEAWCTAFRG